jgi:O-antigen ligase
MITRVLLLSSVGYMLLLGATFTGVVVASLQALNIVMLSVGIITWVVARLQGRWPWYPTALDGVIWLWVAAITVAAVANPDMLRRSQPAIWCFAGLMVAWFGLNDSLSNRLITRRQIGTVLLAVVGISILWAFQELLDPDGVRDGLFGLARVSGLTGNPNLLSALLVPAIGIAFGRVWASAGLGRMLSLVYALIACVILVLSYSRGGWVGGAAAIGILMLAFAVDQGWGTPSGLRAAWGRWKSWQRAAAVAIVVAVVVGGLGMSLYLLDTLDNPGRTAALRTYLWEAAWDGFTEKPLTGNGMFSTPRIILDRSSVPPLSAQPHAHNFPLQVLSELGILGGTAMIASVIVALRAGVMAWRSAPTSRERHLIAGGWAASIGFGVHNLFDLAAWTPYVSLAGLIALMIMTAPPVPVAYPVRKGRAGIALAVGVGIVVVIGGYYSLPHFFRNETLIETGKQRGQWLTAAEGFDDLIAVDPRQPVYHWNQAMLYAMAAQETQDAALAQRALESFNEAAVLGMDSAVLNFNRAALSVQTGDRALAAFYLLEAARYAPDSLNLLVNAALSAERWGMPESARLLWDRIQALPGFENANLSLLPALAQSEIAADYAIPAPVDDAVAAQLLIEGNPAEALALLDAHPEWRASRAHALRALAVFQLGDDPEPHLLAARSAVLGGYDGQWARFAELVTAGEELPSFVLPADPSSLEIFDDLSSGIIARLHFMRQTFNRMIVPQAEYESRDYVLAALAETFREEF